MYFEELKASILNEDDRALKWLYSNYKTVFVEWSARMYAVEKDTAMDTFQEAVVSFYFNIKQGKTLESGVTIKTYLFAIGKNILLSKLRKNRLEVSPITGTILEAQRWDPKLFELEEDQHEIVRMIDKLGAICQRLLKLFYFDNNSMEAIATKMNYKNENVAKTQKMRCLKELKELVKTKDK